MHSKNPFPSIKITNPIHPSIRFHFTLNRDKLTRAHRKQVKQTSAHSVGNKPKRSSTLREKLGKIQLPYYVMQSFGHFPPVESRGGMVELTSRPHRPDTLRITTVKLITIHQRRLRRFKTAETYRISSGCLVLGAHGLTIAWRQRRKSRRQRPNSISNL